MLQQLLETVEIGKIMSYDDLITDQDLQALVDNQLEPARQERVMAAIEEDRWLRDRYTQLRRQKALLMQWWEEERENLH